MRHLLHFSLLGLTLFACLHCLSHPHCYTIGILENLNGLTLSRNSVK